MTQIITDILTRVPTTPWPDMRPRLPERLKPIKLLSLLAKVE